MGINYLPPQLHSYIYNTYVVEKTLAVLAPQ